MDLGRYVKGQFVTPAVAVVSGGNAATPDAAPTATISGPSPTRTVKLAMDGGPTAFALPIQIDDSFALGTYSVEYAYSVGGSAGSPSSDTFDVIAGGDLGGKVIAMAAYVRPDAQYVVVQTDAGKLLQGRNPRL